MIQNLLLANFCLLMSGRNQIILKSTGDQSGKEPCEGRNFVPWAQFKIPKDVKILNILTSICNICDFKPDINNTE